MDLVSLRSAMVLAALSSMVSLAAPTTASALGCRNRIVRVGDSAAHVRAVCGEPASVASHTESRTELVQYQTYAGFVGLRTR